jgi:hypothetical protein
MITQREAAAIFRNKATMFGFVADVSRYPIRRIIKDLKISIAAVKKFKLDNGMEPTKQDMVVLPCVGMKQVDRADCPTVPPSGLWWSRSVFSIPNMLFIDNISNMLGESPFSIIPWDKLRVRTNSRSNYVKGRPIATFKHTSEGMFLYILNTSLEAVSLTGIPEDFEEALNFPKCDEDPKTRCNPLELPIGADYDTLEKAIEILTKKEREGAATAQGIDLDENGRPVN